MPWLGLAATIGWNLHRHRNDKSTICAVTRRTIPARMVIPAWAAFSAWLLAHLIRGYPHPPQR